MKRKFRRLLEKDGRLVKQPAEICLFGDWQKLVLTSHDIDATTAALAGYLHLKRKTELIVDPEEGTIVTPKPRDWRTQA